MRRVADLLGQELASLWGGTFHSIGNRILRQHAPLLGYQRDFSILDREDAKHLIATCVAESEVDVKASRFPKAEVLGDIFSLALNTHKTIPQVLEEQYNYFSQLRAPDRRHREALRGAQAGDERHGFRRPAGALAEAAAGAPETRELYQRRFQFILVDEYQDTNRLQSDLIDLLAARASQCDGGRRRRAEHLRVARGEFRKHPEISEALSRIEGLQD